MPNVVVVVPTYNEIENIASIARRKRVWVRPTWLALLSLSSEATTTSFRSMLMVHTIHLIFRP